MTTYESGRAALAALRNEAAPIAKKVGGRVRVLPKPGCMLWLMLERRGASYALASIDHRGRLNHLAKGSGEPHALSFVAAELERSGAAQRFTAWIHLNQNQGKA